MLHKSQDLLSGLFKGGGISPSASVMCTTLACWDMGCSGSINQRASSTVPSGWRFKTAISTIRSLEILVPVVSKSKAKGRKGQRHNQKGMVRSSFKVIGYIFYKLTSHGSVNNAVIITVGEDKFLANANKIAFGGFYCGHFTYCPYG